MQIIMSLVIILIKKTCNRRSDNFMAGDKGFEPLITGPEPVALPLGQSPIAWLLYDRTVWLSTNW